jgi:hypothetical protein
MIRFRKIGGETCRRRGWRTDVPTNVYRQWPDVLFVRWQTPNGDACVIPAGELRRVLADARPRDGHGDKILFQIDPENRTIRLDGSDDAIPVAMEVLPGPGPNGDAAPKLVLSSLICRRRCRSKFDCESFTT